LHRSLAGILAGDKVRAFICGLVGPELSNEERQFLSDQKPWGVILFARNLENESQIKTLTADIRIALDRERAPILIDQEGGRVQRICPPVCRPYPAARTYGDLYHRDPVLGVEAARLGAKLIGIDLADLGITVNCMPVLDIPAEGSDAAIGDRAYGDDADTVLTLGGAAADGLMAVGIVPVMKHMPGHGRAEVDSHNDLPIINTALETLEATDFKPFRLWARRFPAGMTAHVVLTAVDDKRPATLSDKVINGIIRGRFGFDGLLMTDDISMDALKGPVGKRAEKAIRAGCDVVLHCSGDADEMAAVAAAVPELEGDALRRAKAVFEAISQPPAHDRKSLHARFDDILAQVESV
jgi:beta-N-acetylhexosaminidase